MELDSIVDNRLDRVQFLGIPPGLLTRRRLPRSGCSSQIHISSKYAFCSLCKDFGVGSVIRLKMWLVFPSGFPLCGV